MKESSAKGNPGIPAWTLLVDAPPKSERGTGLWPQQEREPLDTERNFHIRKKTESVVDKRVGVKPSSSSYSPNDAGQVNCPLHTQFSHL